MYAYGRWVVETSKLWTWSYASDKNASLFSTAQARPLHLSWLISHQFCIPDNCVPGGLQWLQYFTAIYPHSHVLFKAWLSMIGSVEDVWVGILGGCLSVCVWLCVREREKEGVLAALCKVTFAETRTPNISACLQDRERLYIPLPILFCQRSFIVAQQQLSFWQDEGCNRNSDKEKSLSSMQIGSSLWCGLRTQQCHPH